MEMFGVLINFICTYIPVWVGERGRKEQKKELSVMEDILLSPCSILICNIIIQKTKKFLLRKKHTTSHIG